VIAESETPVAEVNINRGKKEDDSTSLSNPEGDELLPLLDGEVPDLPQVHAEGEEEPLLQVHEEVVVVVKQFTAQPLNHPFSELYNFHRQSRRATGVFSFKYRPS
jgi:hypothetical protein